MKSLLEKLDRSAEAWLHSMDDHLNAPIVRAMTGKVFTHGTPSDTRSEQESLPCETAPANPPAHRTQPTFAPVLNPR